MKKDTSKMRVKSKCKWTKKREKELRDKIIRALQNQGFEVEGQMELDLGGFFYKGKFIRYEDEDPRYWGYK